MRIQEMRNISGTLRRGAFTLIELLVVIAIIAALMALSAAAVIKFMGSQQIANTQTTLDKTQAKLTSVWGKVKDDANKSAMSELVPGGGGITVKQWIQTNLAGTDVNATNRIRVIYVKLKLRQVFPMNFNEAVNPYPLPPLPAYTAYLGQLGIAGTLRANYESSACLLMALQRGVSGAGIDSTDLTSGGATGSTPSPNGGNIIYLTDAWGSPIYFTRVPSGNLLLNPNGPMPGANDPGDPQGYLQMAAWGTTYGPAFSALTLQQLAPGNKSFKLAPMVGSGGMDKTFSANQITFAPVVGSDDQFSSP